MSTIKLINDIKASLSKELPVETISDASVERCQDMLQRLGEFDISLPILSETLIGTVVSKFKSHTVLGPLAKSLVKKWKEIARTNDKPTTSTSTTTTTKTKTTTTAVTPKNTSTSTTAKVSKPSNTNTSNSDLVADPEWKKLPPLRRNIVTKLHSLFELSRDDMIHNAGVNEEAFREMTVSCASEIEQAIEDKLGKKDRSAYTEKSRSLCFNLKKNSQLRANLLMGSTSADELVSMSSEDLATSAKAEARNAEIKKLRDSRLLDWEQQNESKINEMCGIKGDLLSASLFTCSRCKSVKTTSTQKQTRSADEPMTVFVLCLNCGKRWKC
jgi:transcription elongation factor S-II